MGSLKPKSAVKIDRAHQSERKKNQTGLRCVAVSAAKPLLEPQSALKDYLHFLSMASIFLHASLRGLSRISPAQCELVIEDDRMTKY